MTYLFHDVREGVTRCWLSPLPLLHSEREYEQQFTTSPETSYLGGEADGAAAASAAALARPCKASMGALRVERGRVSSDSSSEEGAVLGTIPYVAYLCG